MMKDGKKIKRLTFYKKRKVSKCKWRKAATNGHVAGAGASRVSGGRPPFEPALAQLFHVL
jgi:hypothetical protein